MFNRILSDEDVTRLRRALYGRCSHLGISPDGAEAQFIASQLMELFQCGIVDEHALRNRPFPMAAVHREH